MLHETILSWSQQITLFNNHNGYGILINNNYLHWLLHGRSKEWETKNHNFLL
jgi:hypothetical protein